MSAQRASPVSRALLFNVGGAALVALSIYLAIKSSFAPKPETPLCEARYAGGVLFSLARQNGTALAPEDLQARLGGLDRGLVANSRIVADAAVPYGYALEIQLKRAKRDEDDQSRSGIGFTWLPRQLPVASAACLSYSVWTPDDFRAGDGGVLPGLASENGAENAPPPAPQGQAGEAGETVGQAKLRPFAVRPQWRADGGLLLWQSPAIGQGGVTQLDPAKAMLKPGRWVRIETETVLNTPAQLDGILRMWVDGKLVHEQHGVGFRQDELQSFQAVLGAVHNVRHGVWAASSADTRVRLSPLELRLK